MKKINNKIKILSAILIGIIIGSSIAVYAASYFAKDVSYKKGDTEISVEQALNDLYKNKFQIYETGTVSGAIPWKCGYTTFKCNLNKSYTQEDKAKIVFTGYSPYNNSAPLYFNNINGYITGDKYEFTVVNYAGDDYFNTTYTINYSIIRYCE